MTENSFDKTTCYSDEEFWGELELLYDYPRDEQNKTRPYLRDEKGERLPSVLEKMAKNVIKDYQNRSKKDPGTHDPLNYDASDLAQLTVQKCWKNREKFDPSHENANFPGWVKTAMIRAWQDKKSLKWLDIETKITTKENDDDKGGDEEDSEVIDNIGGSDDTPEELLIDKEDAEARKHCFKVIEPPKHKIAFGHRTQKIKLHTIAELMGANINTVTYWVKQGKLKYYSCIKEEGVY